MNPLALHAIPSATADNAPEVRLEIGAGDLRFAAVITPEEAYAYAAVIVAAADRANLTSAQQRQAVRP